METHLLRLIILSILVALSWEQRRPGIGTAIGALSGRSRESSASRPNLSRDELPSSSASTQEAEYVYEYYDEPDYQHYPPKPPTTHSRPNPLFETLQGRRANGPTASTAAIAKANILARERFTPPTSTTRRPNPTHAQFSRLIHGLSSTESPQKFLSEKPVTAEEYEYVYEDAEPETPPSKEIETKVSVSVSESKHTSTPLPKLATPETGIVISVATTRSVSSRFNPIPQTTPTAPAFIPRVVPPEPAKEIPKIVTRRTTPPPPPPPPPPPTTSVHVKIEAPPSSTVSGIPDLGIKFEDVSKFLPPDYKKPQVRSFLPKIQFQEVLTQDFLPKDYVISTAGPPSPPTVSTTTVATTTTKPSTISTTMMPSTSSTPQPTSPPPPPIDPLQAIMNKIRFDDDISLLLPPGYKEKSLLPPDYQLVKNETSTSTTVPPPASTPAQPTLPPKGKLVFPTRPGGVKAVRPSTPEPVKAETPAPPKVALKSGWPTRKTTEFTGWPTVSTTPSPTSPTTSTTTTVPPSTEPTTTIPTTTTTQAPPKRNPVTSCEPTLCKMEATLRITGGIRWKPEYGDINTDEWKHLESTVKRELDGAYRSSGLAPFYRSIEIEAFNEGSVVVDYFVLLDNVDRVISSEQIRSLFHAALLQADEPFEKDRLRLGRYAIDPRYTDFKARAFEAESVTGELEEVLIPQWGIAVIVIGLASLLFVIIFAVTLMVSKQRKGGGKKSGVSLTQEMLNEFNKRGLGGSGGDIGMRRDDLYNLDDGWDESHLERTLDLRSGSGRHSSSSNKEGYNIYDSWKTEWHGNGYNHHFGRGGDSSSRRRSDYDTNF